MARNCYQAIVDIKLPVFVTILTIFVILACLSPAGAVNPDDEWTHLFTKDGIAVYRRTAPETGLCAFKGVGLVDARPSVVGSVLQDISAYPQWVDRCRESVLLKEIGSDTKIFYSVVDTPLPFKDRDVILRNKTAYDAEKGALEITFDVFNQILVPPKDDYCRVSDLYSKYLIEPYQDNKTRVTVIYQGDPGGNIPVTIANWVATRRYPHTVIMGLRGMVKKQKYLTSSRCNGHKNEN